MEMLMPSWMSLAKAIVTPWYLPAKKDSSNENYNISKAYFEEYISPLKASSVERRSSDVDGNSHRLFPSGYILMDYNQKTVRQWILILLRLDVDGDKNIYELFKQISYSNFSSWNHTSTLFSRAHTISKVFLKKRYTLGSQEDMKSYYEKKVSFEYKEGKLKYEYLTNVIDLISLFNYINSSFYSNKHKKVNFYEDINILKLSNLAINILNLIKIIDKHVDLISFEKNSIINYLIREKKINFTKYFKSL
jgi:hypothetical protein